MAKIDISKIKGYEEMSLEDKLNALLDYEMPEAHTTGEVEKLKSALSKANSDAADWKRQFREKQSEQERAEAERAEREKAALEELTALKKERMIDKLEKQYLTVGYSAELAAQSAKAQADGDTESVLKYQMAYLEQKTKDIEAAALSNQKGLSVGDPPKAMTHEDEVVATAMRYAGVE